MISFVMDIRIVVVNCSILSDQYQFDYTKDGSKHRGLDPNVQCPDIRLFDGAKECKFASLKQARRTPYD